ncbi:MAG TPA: amidohydrolase family protein [Rhabdochlamydiaceae bacterium]|nr:amidohydrolase family protein [Rhabdochlamydiaceae bacterium]
MQSSKNAENLPTIDCHLHYIDAQHNSYPHLKKIDPGFATVVGDYSSLPHKYLPEAYLKDTKGFNIVKTVMAEFISDDPLKEAKWAQSLADRFGHPHGIIALASPLDPNFEHLLNEYQKIPNVRALRDHMLYDPDNPLKRFAKRPGMLMEPEWRKNFAKLKNYGFSWEFEIFAPQIPEAVDLAQAFPNIRMILHPMGWPLDLSPDGFTYWKKQMRSISKYENVLLKITAIACIFRHWTLEQIRPWIREAIEIFGPARTMFGSNMPLEKLDHSFTELYNAYQASVKDLSLSDQKNVFHDTAERCYHLEQLIF